MSISDEAIRDLIDAVVYVPADETDACHIIDMDIVSTSNVAIATVSAVIQGEVVTVTGDSRRYLDEPNPEIGELLAAGRALEKLARKVLKRANGLVTQADHNVRIRPEQKARRIAWEASQSKGESTKTQAIVPRVAMRVEMPN